MKKVFMSLAIVAAMFAAASCACCGNKAAEETAPCETETCCEDKACCDTCTATCDSTKCAACDSTAADCAAKAE